MFNSRQKTKHKDLNKRKNKSMKKAILTALMVAGLALTACTNTVDQWGNKQTVGTGLGAVAGGLAGSQIGGGSGRLWATGAGVLLGALAGGEIGASLDEADRVSMQQAQTRAYSAPIGQTINWNNPQSGHSGTYVATRDGTSSDGRYCREYQQTVNVGGKQQSAYGTACRQPDGSWQIAN
jgi:surface antigen